MLRCFRKGVGGMKTSNIFSTENGLCLKIDISVDIDLETLRRQLQTLLPCFRHVHSNGYHKGVCLRSYKRDAFWEGDLVRTEFKIMMSR